VQTIIEAIGLVGVAKEGDALFRLLLPNLSDPTQSPLPGSLKIKPHRARLLFRNHSRIGGTLPGCKISDTFGCESSDHWSGVEIAGYEVDFRALTTPLDTTDYKLTRLSELLLSLGGEFDRQQVHPKFLKRTPPLIATAQENLSSRVNITNGVVSVESRRHWQFRYLKGRSFELFKAIRFSSESSSSVVISFTPLFSEGDALTLELEAADGQTLILRVENNEVPLELGQECGGVGHYDFAGHYVLLQEPGILFPFYPYPTRGPSGIGGGGDAQCSPIQIDP
jgi:hypothetical protein